VAELIPIESDLTDPRILLAIRQAENGGPGREMGVLSVPAPDYTSQVDVAARTVKNTEARYIAATGLAPADNGRYTDEFIGYLSQGGPGYPGYAPQGAANDPRGLNANHRTNLSSAYSARTQDRGPQLIPLDDPPVPTSDRLREGSSPSFSGLTAPAPEPPTEAMGLPTLQEAYSAFAEPATKAVAWGLRQTPVATFMRYLGGVSDATMDTGSRGVAEVIVPQTPTGAGAFLGTLPFGGPAGRILGAAGGAALGSAGSGNELAAVGKDAALSGAGAALGEGVSALGSKLIRSLPNNPFFGGKRNIAEGDAAGYGARMGEQSPPLAGAGTAQDLRTMASGPGRTALGDAKEQVVQAVEAQIGNQALPMPSLGGTGMSLRQANDALSEIGARAFSKNPLDRTFNGIDQRRLYGEVARDIEAGLGAIDPRAAAMFAEGQAVYRQGMAFLKPLERQDAFRMDPSGLQFNTPAIQRLVNSPKGEAMLRNKLGDEGFEALRDTMLRGGAPGEVDRLAGGPGGLLDALLQMGRQGGGFGTTAALPFRTALPNVGSRYAGTAPYTAPAGAQALLDYLGIQAADQFQQAQGGTPIKIGPTYGR